MKRAGELSTLGVVIVALLITLIGTLAERQESAEHNSSVSP